MFGWIWTLLLALAFSEETIHEATRNSLTHRYDNSPELVTPGLVEQRSSIFAVGSSAAFLAAAQSLECGENRSLFVMSQASMRSEWTPQTSKTFRRHRLLGSGNPNGRIWPMGNRVVFLDILPRSTKSVEVIWHKATVLVLAKGDGFDGSITSWRVSRRWFCFYHTLEFSWTLTLESVATPLGPLMRGST